MTHLARAAGQAIAQGLGTGPRRGTLATQELEIRAMAVRGRVSSPSAPWRGGSLPWRAGFSSTWRVAGAVALALAFVVMASAVLRRAETPDGALLHAKWDGKPVDDHAALVTDAAAEKTLAFSDGSRIVLERATAARLAGLGGTRAELTLTRGHIDASIRKRTGVTWTVAAGPYAVRVVGTRFGVDWDADAQVLKVTVREGRVRVSGGDLPRDGVALDAGAELERHYLALRGAAGDRKADGDQRAVQANPEPARPKDEPVSGAVRSDKRGAAPPAAGDARPDWAKLAAKGRYLEALVAAKTVGVERLVAELAQNDLLLLANTARHGGDAALARQALLQLRQRFSGTAAAQLATLYLARVAEDMDHNPEEAVRWLRNFLRESPTGDLAASARASLMSILVASGDSARARVVAKDYLLYHPNGPHASKARSLLEQTSSR